MHKNSFLTLYEPFFVLFHRVADPYPGPYSDPDWIRIQSGQWIRIRKSGSGSRRAKMTHKSRKKLKNFMFSSVGWPLLRAEGFFSNLDVLYGGLGIGKF
jgi:hypothetical protein